MSVWEQNNHTTKAISLSSLTATIESKGIASFGKYVKHRVQSQNGAAMPIGCCQEIRNWEALKTWETAIVQTNMN